MTVAPPYHSTEYHEKSQLLPRGGECGHSLEQVKNFSYLLDLGNIDIALTKLSGDLEILGTEILKKEEIFEANIKKFLAVRTRGNVPFVGTISVTSFACSLALLSFPELPSA